ncbi:MAG: hypothetical protein D6761_08760 [Candidatus Dadabacteria bacterium]|nr:MAG: hypothetical protein D6761_08760 [Candidatus Dadabacteria bacterium]
MTSRIAVVFASRFGTTRLLAERIAEGIREAGGQAALIDVAEGAADVADADRIILLTAIIWDRPLAAMRRYLQQHGDAIRDRLLALGTVCGSAGVRPQGGLVYARQLAKRVAAPDVERFSLSGRIPPREAMASWEWWALRLFASVFRKPQLFEIQPDEAGARKIGAAAVAAAAGSAGQGWAMQARGGQQ